MLEWMDDNIVREFEATADDMRKTNGDGRSKDATPFDFRHIKLLERPAQIEKLLSQTSSSGRVILASDETIEWGFSKDVLKSLAQDPNNLVVLTDKPALSTVGHPSIARTLWEWWNEKNDANTSNGETTELVPGSGRELRIHEAKREGLEGEELAAYQQWLATKRQLQATLQTGGAMALEATADVADDASSESSSDSEASDDEQQGKALNISTTMGQATRKKVVLSDADLGINVLTKKKGASDFDVRGKKGRERSFPLALRRKRDDQFGDLIRPEDYLRDEEKEEETQAASRMHGDDDNQRKRRWDDDQQGPNKRQTAGHRNGMDDADGAGDPNGPPPDELDEVEDIPEENIQGPAKLVTSSYTISVNFRIGFIDFAGLHDKRSLNNLIPLIQPRKLILVGGSQAETSALAADCKHLLAAQLGTSEGSVADVMTPQNGEWVDASVETNAWVVRLADDLVKKLRWQNVRGLGIVTITGQLVRQGVTVDKDVGANKRFKTAETDEGEETAAGGEDAAEEKVADAVPTLDTLPVSMVSAARSTAQPLHVGDLRLTDLRRAMQSAGYTAEFRGEGTLVINGTVTVRKAATGQIELESIGVTDPTAMVQHRSTFYEVKRMIYDGLAVVAGA
jgi:cleavage and polyadenylation specificity factor subunit 2